MIKQLMLGLGLTAAWFSSTTMSRAQSVEEDVPEIQNKPAYLESDLAKRRALRHEPETLLTLAEQGDPEAQFKLGQLYVDAKASQQNIELGAKWLLEAANKGHAKAQVALAEIYLYEWNQPEEAKRWIAAAATSGDPEALLMLTRYYQEYPDQLPKGLKPLDYLVQAARTGDAEAQYQLGLELMSQGSEDDAAYNEGVSWMRQAAAQGHDDALKMLQD